MISLFTTPPAPPEGSKSPDGAVIGAIKEGAQKSGADFSYLVKTARRESSLDPKARASRSTAEGLFQFVEQTWLGTLKEAGPKLGLGRFSQSIIETKPGHYDVPDPKMRIAILSLRSDPKISSLLAGALTQSNGEALQQNLGRKASAEDLYLAHLLGVQGATETIRRSEVTPDEAASTIFPDAARSNPSLFFDNKGHARSISELRILVAELHKKAEAAKGDVPTEDPFPPLAFAHPDGPALYSLFRNIGPIDLLSGVAQQAEPVQPVSAPQKKKPLLPIDLKQPLINPIVDDTLLTEEIDNEQ
ncbi:MAG: lytic transglycosylase domain-containing protein [Alphaproteobacteria bacterium]|nr:lytic transglycosylase domain-containing protein [Alphaproteobacteria bacterium]